MSIIFRMLLFLAASLTAARTVLADDIDCSKINTGVVVYETESDKRYISVEKIEVDAFQPTNLDDLKQDVLLLSKLALKDDNRVPKNASGRLLGVVIVGVCEFDGYLFGITMVSEQSVKQAIRLRETIASSFQRSRDSQDSFMNLHFEKNK